MRLKKIHHISRVVDDIKEELEKYSKIGFTVEQEIFIDEEQKVKVGKVKTTDCMIIELLEPLDEESPIYKFSKEKKGFHHICIEVENLENFINYIKENNLGFQLTKITKSVFEGRRVCFISTNDREIIELIE